MWRDDHSIANKDIKIIGNLSGNIENFQQLPSGDLAYLTIEIVTHRERKINNKLASIGHSRKKKKKENVFDPCVRSIPQ